MFVSEIYSDACATLGNCDQATVLRRLTDAVKTLADKGTWDATLGEMDFCVYDGLVTLPAEVGTVLGVVSGGRPTVIRDDWYNYHVGGTGPETYQPIGFTDLSATSPVYREPPKPCYLQAVTEVVSDNNKKLRVFGWDENGKRIFTAGPTGELQDGFLVPLIFGSPIRASGVPAIAKIERVQKDTTSGFIKLIAVDPSTGTALTQIGYYQPYETIPAYKRIRVQNQDWCRVKYKRKDLELRSLNDWINIDNRPALLLALKAIKFRQENNFSVAREAEAEATRLMKEEDASLTTNEIDAPQIIYADYPDKQDDDRLFY